IFEMRREYQEQDWSVLERTVRLRIAELHRQGETDALRRPLYAIVEKILINGEPLSDDWPTHGTTGYEFLNVINGLFVDVHSAEPFTRTYERWAKEHRPFSETVYDSKFMILQNALASELHML